MTSKNLRGDARAAAPRVTIASDFWRRYRELVRDEVLPYQWDVLTDAIPLVFPDDPAGNHPIEARSGAVANLRIAAGLEQGDFTGFPYEDSDLYKWLEAVAYTLAAGDAPELRRHADELVELIAAAQMEDGYLDSFYQIRGIEKRFSLLQQSHELYVMGHYIEAGIAYWEATGSELALDVALRMADCIDRNFGPEEGKIHGGDGHPEIELALARLYEATGEERYLALARWFIVTRGEDPDFFERQCEQAGDEQLFDSMRGLPRSYYQADKPYLEQNEVKGHAVRALYLLTAAAQVARLAGDDALGATADRLWDNASGRRMYVTGGLGSTQRGESFTCDYDLPNATIYGETCASVAMSFLSRQMLARRASGAYGDVLERELFNGTISGMGLDGRHFFYVNPLEADPRVSAGSPDRRHVLTRRAEWFATPCCPANLARLVASIDRYVYAEADGGATVLVDQYIASRAEFASGVVVEQRGDYPWDGRIELAVSNGSDGDMRLGLRIPGWVQGDWALEAGGEKLAPEVVDGFAYVSVPAGAEASLVLTLPLKPVCVRANTRIGADAGLVAVTRGPVVYCMEGVDNPGDLWGYVLDVESLSSSWRPELLGGVCEVRGRGLRACPDEGGAGAYAPVGSLAWEDAELVFVPYYAWCNREEGQMRVWVRPSDPLVS